MSRRDEKAKFVVADVKDAHQEVSEIIRRGAEALFVQETSGELGLVGGSEIAPYSASKGGECIFKKVLIIVLPVVQHIDSVMG